MTWFLVNACDNKHWHFWICCRMSPTSKHEASRAPLLLLDVLSCVHIQKLQETTNNHAMLTFCWLKKGSLSSLSSPHLLWVLRMPLPRLGVDRPGAVGLWTAFPSWRGYRDRAEQGSHGWWIF